MSRRTASLHLPISAGVATGTGLVTLAPVFLRGTWVLPSVAAVVLVVTAAELTRRRATSRLAPPVAATLVLVGYLALRYAGAQAYWHLVPSPDSLDRVGALLRAGREDIAAYAAPIGVSPGIEVITVAGVGLVAILVDTLAVTLRRPSWAALPLLTLYLVPTAVAPGGVPWLAFVVAGAGFLGLLLAESRERVLRWGRPMSGLVGGSSSRPGSVETSALSQVGRRVGAGALAVSVVVPALLPDLALSSFGLGSGAFGSGAGGDRQVAVINPVLDLGESLRRPENRVVITYRGRPAYLRLAALDDFTGDQWRPRVLKVDRDRNDVEDGLAVPPGLSPEVARIQRQYRIKVLNLKQTWLPLPYPARRVRDVDGTWLYDRETFNVFGENTSTLGLEYSATAWELQPTADQLRAAAGQPSGQERNLRLPAGLPASIAVRAQSVVAGEPTPYDQALALQNWLRSDAFSYTTELPAGDGTGSSAILTFLQTGQGYCVQFASTMAVMARTLGIPARVAVGFTAGTPTGPDGLREVTLHDAHAWPELYFDNIGWVAFEPTPAVRTGEPPPWARGDAGPALPGSNPRPEQTTAPGEGLGTSPRVAERRPNLPEFAPVPGGAGATGQAGGGFPVLPVVVSLSLLVLLAVPALARLLIRRRRWGRAGDPAGQVAAAWADLQDALLDVGHAWVPSDSPRAGVNRVVRDRSLAGEPAAAAQRLVAAVERARYAPRLGEVTDPRADLATVRAGLLASATPVARWRARLLPRSTRALATEVADRVADVLDGVDRMIARVSGWVSRRLALR